MWILECPARAAYGQAFLSSYLVPVVTSNAKLGSISLERLLRNLSGVLYRQYTPRVDFIAALSIWKHACDTTWLIFDRNKIAGRVFILAEPGMAETLSWRKMTTILICLVGLHTFRDYGAVVCKISR
jgi:hypothetical protein